MTCVQAHNASCALWGEGEGWWRSCHKTEWKSHSAAVEEWQGLLESRSPVDQHQVATVYKWTRQNLSLSPSLPPSPYIYMCTHQDIQIQINLYYRKKFQSQTSDNMDRWKAEMGRIRREEKRREEVESVASGALFEVEMSKKWTPLWLFPPLLFDPSVLSEVWLLNFLR